MGDERRSTFESVAVIIALLFVLFIASVVGFGVWSYSRGVEVPPMSPRPQEKPEWTEGLEPGDIIVHPNDIGPESPP
jgi:hypothetical protein